MLCFWLSPNGHPFVPTHRWLLPQRFILSFNEVSNPVNRLGFHKRRIVQDRACVRRARCPGTGINLIPIHIVPFDNALFPTKTFVADFSSTSIFFQAHCLWNLSFEEWSRQVNRLLMPQYLTKHSRLWGCYERTFCWNVSQKDEKWRLCDKLYLVETCIGKINNIDNKFYILWTITWHLNYAIQTCVLIQQINSLHIQTFTKLRELNPFTS